MKEIIAIINQKGGVGKSTTAQNIGAGLKLKDFKVLYIDLDAQGNLSYALGADNNALSIMDVLTTPSLIEKSIQSTEQGDIIASSLALAGADTIITSVGKEYRLKEALELLQPKYDYIIVDTPPALGILTVNALTACNSVIIPAQADIYSLQGISQLYNTIQIVKQYCNSNLKVKGILLTRYSNRAVLNREVAELIQETATKFDTKLYKTTIRECIAIKEAQLNQKDIFSYSLKCNASQDYIDLVEEVLERS